MSIKNNIFLRIKKFFRRGTLIDVTAPKDKNQEEYRSFFGIKDKFLIQYSMDSNKNFGYIVFIDFEDDIDWVDKRDDKYWDSASSLCRDIWLAKLNAAESQPCTNLSETDKLQFKKLLGGGYLLALQKQFDAIQDIINESLSFLRARNNEVTRRLFLKYSGIAALIIVLMLFANLLCLQWKLSWSSGIAMGVLGAYVSIWLRYGRLTFTGLSSKCLHLLEVLSRLFIGAISATIALCSIKCGLLLPHLVQNSELYSFIVVGFVAGFSERFIPSLVEKITNMQEDPDTKQEVNNDQNDTTSKNYNE